MRTYPRRSCGLVWSALELQRPIFDRCRYTFSFFCFFFVVDPDNIKILLFPFTFKRTGPEIMSRLQISPRAFERWQNYLSTTKSDRLGVKTRSRLSPKALTRRTPPKKHVFPSGNHWPDKRSFQKNSFLSFFFSD